MFSFISNKFKKGHDSSTESKVPCLEQKPDQPSSANTPNPKLDHMMSCHQQLSTFKLFPYLPQELQLEIWEQTFFIPRLVLVGRPYWTVPRDILLGAGTYSRFPGSSILPPNFPDVGALMEKNFENIGVQAPRSGTSSFTAYVNYQSDIIFLLDPVQEFLDHSERDLPMWALKARKMVITPGHDERLLEMERSGIRTIREEFHEARRVGASMVGLHLIAISKHLEVLYVVMSDQQELVRWMEQGRDLNIQDLEPQWVKSNDWLTRIRHRKPEKHIAWFERKCLHQMDMYIRAVYWSTMHHPRARPPKVKLVVVHEEGRPYGKDGRYFRW